MQAIIQKICFLSFLCLLLPLPVYANEHNTVVATMNRGVTPDGMAITPDNRFAYVANNNNYGITDGDSVTVLNLKNNTVKQKITDSSFDEPFKVAINPHGTKAYIPNSNDTTKASLILQPTS